MPGEPTSPDRSGAGTDLQRWVSAGLISEDQAQAIGAFEAKRLAVSKQGRATRAIALLGGLTLVSGVGSLVAYNWDRLGDGLKLFLMMALLGAGIASALRARSRQTTPVSVSLDVSLVIVAGLTLAGLALTSQIYRQDGELWVLLAVWCGLTTPLLSYARTRFAHFFWYVALFSTLLAAQGDLLSYLRRATDWDYQIAEATSALILFGLSGLLAVRFAASRYSGRMHVGLSLSQIHIVALGLFGGLIWKHGDDGYPILWLIGVTMMGLVLVFLPASAERLGWGDRSALRGLVALGGVLAVLPLGLPVDSGVLAFAAYIAFWSLAWYLAERVGYVRNARLAVGAIGIRVVIASFELFESLLVTGSVLVLLGGAALVWSRWAWSPAAEGGAHE